MSAPPRRSRGVPVRESAVGKGRGEDTDGRWGRGGGSPRAPGGGCGGTAPATEDGARAPRGSGPSAAAPAGERVGQREPVTEEEGGVTSWNRDAQGEAGKRTASHRGRESGAGFRRRAQTAATDLPTPPPGPLTARYRPPPRSFAAIPHLAGGGAGPAQAARGGGRLGMARPLRRTGPARGPSAPIRSGTGPGRGAEPAAAAGSASRRRAVPGPPPSRPVLSPPLPPHVTAAAVASPGAAPPWRHRGRARAHVGGGSPPPAGSRRGESPRGDAPLPPAP